MDCHKPYSLISILLMVSILVSGCAQSQGTPANAGSAQTVEPSIAEVTETVPSAVVTGKPTQAATAVPDLSQATPVATLRDASVYYIQSVVSKFFLTDSAFETNGSQVEQQPLTGDKNQQWRFVALTGEDAGFFQIQSADGRRCLDSTGGARNQEGNYILVNPCGSGDGQKWQSDPCSGGDWVCQVYPGSVWLQSNGGRVLDLPNDSKTAGEKINSLAQKHGGQNQQWWIKPAGQ